MNFKRIDNTGGAPGTFVYKINVLAADLSDNSETDTGGNIASDIIVEDCYFYVNTADTATTKTLSVGLLSSESGGDADGFVVALATGSTGPVYPTLTSGAQTLGALLTADENGSGVLVRESHSSSSVTAKSVSITHGDASGATALDMDIYLVCRNAVING